MGRLTRENISTIAYIMVGVIACIVVGYVNFHRAFVHFPRPMLPFLVVGLTGGLMYAMVRLRRAGLAILMIVLLYLSQLAMTPPIRASTLSAAAIFAIPVGFAILAGSYAQQALARFKIRRFIVMGIVVAVGYGLMMVLFLARSHTEVRLAWVRAQALVGLELGAAMGLGFELVDFLGPRRRPRPKQPVSDS